ncbi:Protein KES1, partial [Hypsizygus marmoreus]
AVPASQRGSWTSFLKSIASFSGDLSSLTAPPFILSPVFLTEFPAYWCEHPDIFAAIADAKDDESRALAVLRWFISTLKGQYTSRNESMGSEKKYPSTPSSASTTTLLVEQVSHHPPITAYVIENKTKGLRLIGHNAQKTSFSAGSIIVKQIGHAILTVSLPNNTKVEYLITLPRLRIDGLWYGSPYIELTDTSYIVGGGYVSTIEFKGKEEARPAWPTGLNRHESAEADGNLADVV